MTDDDELLDRLQREQDALAEAEDARERAARRLLTGTRTDRGS